jgi:AcrR family transcriptional regulator
METDSAMSRTESANRRRTRRTTSTLRERHLEQTREMIFSALLDQVAESGIADFSIPEVARDAGVSIRTVYRYFPTKDALLEAFGDWLDAQAEPQEWPKDADALARKPELLFPAFEEREPIIRSQWVTPQGRSIRARNRVRRLAARREALRDVISNLDEQDAEDAVAVISYLLSSRAWLALKDDFDMDGERSGQAISWAIQTLVANLRRRNEAAAARDGSRRVRRRTVKNTSD